jgi:L-ribulose-5-phosphate 3-epimerase
MVSPPVRSTTTGMEISRMRPVGIYEKALPSDLSWSARLDFARAAGFDFVEISVDESDSRLARLEWPAAQRAELREAVAATGVRIPTMCLSAHRKWALGSADPSVRSRGLDIMHRAIDFAADTGIRVIQIAGYYVYYEPHVEGSRERYTGGLARGLEWASGAMVTLALENVDGHDVDSVSRAMEFVDAFRSPFLQVYPDVGNLAEHGLDVCAELARGQGHIVGLHAKDTRPGEPRRVPFGAGITPFVPAFRQLALQDFRGPVLLEMWNDDAPDAFTIIREAREWIVARMLEAGLEHQEPAL